MFTGIVETTGRVVKIVREDSNVHFDIAANFLSELKVDQSIAHNGVCLTVVAINEDCYRVTAILETLNRSNLNKWREGDWINLERCMRMNDRLDGHIVQGHVDQTAECISIEDLLGSWKYGFSYPHQPEMVTVSKGSICINGVSLTVIDSSPGCFSVAIIPYTFEHTNFKNLNTGDLVNLEFDIIGKYVARLLAQRSENL